MRNISLNVTMPGLARPQLLTDTAGNRISYYLLVCFLVMLPFDRLYSELALICFLVHELIRLTQRKIQAIQLRYILLPVSVYLLTCAGTIYTDFPGRAFDEWERQLAILLFPLLFGVTDLDIRRYKLPLLKTLAISCVITLVYLYYEAFRVISFNDLPVRSLLTTSFINHNFSEPIGIHATYFSMYIALSFSSFIYLFLKERAFTARVAYATGLLILLVGLIQLASRSVLIALIVIVNLLIPVFLLKKGKRIWFIACSLAISASSIWVITQSSALKSRYVTELKNDLTQQSINLGILEPRRQRWDCAWGLIKAAPLSGHGSGSEIPLLKETYFDKKYYNSYIQELNAHSQFLSMLIKTGVCGLLIFLAVLFAGFRQSVRNRDFVYASFMVIVTVVCFSENILDGNKGIFFFAFFYAMFFVDAARQRSPVPLTQK